MRQFNAFEKEIIRLIVEREEEAKNLTGYPLIGFNELLNQVVLKKYNGKITVGILEAGGLVMEVETAYSVSEESIRFSNLLIRELINVINLLDYLLKNDIVYFISPSVLELKGSYIYPISLGNIVIKDNNQHLTTAIDHESFVKKFDFFYEKRLYSNQILIDYYHNGYKTDEELRHEENINAAQRSLELSKNSLEESQNSLITSKRALKISVIIGIVSIVLSITSIILDLNEKKSDVRIDKTQFETLSKELKSIENKLEQTIEQNSKKKNDSLVVLPKSHP